MTKRIFISIFLVSLIILFISSSVVTGVLYHEFNQNYKQQIRNETEYIAKGIEKYGVDFLDSQSNGQDRITLIKSDGTVIFDTDEDIKNLDNHSDREEFIEALKNGEGESFRHSDTLSEDTFYYALKLSDQSVLRVSSAHSSFTSFLISASYPVSVILILLIGLSLLISLKVSRNIVKPINDIDLSNPQNTCTYDELSPLVRRIASQNKQINEQLSELVRKQQEFSTITENMSEGFLVIDNMTNVLSYNKSALILFNADTPLQNQSVLTLNRSENFRNIVRKVLSGNHGEQNITINQKVYQIIANPVFKGSRIVGAIMIIFDISEKEALEKMRREFTANVSHELKTPLTSISGFAEIMKNGMVRKEDIPHFANNIYTESQRLISLVEDIIKLSRLDEKEDFDSSFETIDLLELVKDVLKTLEVSAQNKDISLKLEGERVTVNGVYRILEEMIYNICDNAIKYNKENGTVKVAVTKDNTNVILSVSDTGIGIPKNDIERVFERFYRVDKSHSKEIGGTGLGLSIVKHGAILHNADVKIESDEGKGTTVKLIFK